MMRVSINSLHTPARSILPEEISRPVGSTEYRSVYVHESLVKFLKDLEDLVDRLYIYRRNLTVNQHINLFYYLQKMEMLRILHHLHLAGEERMCEMLNAEITSIARQWKHDAEWLRNYLSNELSETKTNIHA